MLAQIFRGQNYSIDATLPQMEALRSVFIQFLKDSRLSEEDTEGWRLVFTEAVVNAIIHGSCSDSAKQVHVCWKVAQDAVTLEVTDCGLGPDEVMIQGLDLPKDPMQEHGRGLYLMDMLCTQCVGWRSSSGYRLCLIKNHPEISLKDEDPVLEQTLEELSQCYESLAAFYRLGDALTISEKVSDFIREALADMMQVLRAKGVRLIFSPKLQARLLDELRTLPEDQTVPTAEEQNVIEGADEFVWESTHEVAHIAEYRLWSCGRVGAIRAHGEVLGVFVVARTQGESYFRAAELNTIRTLADLFGIAIAQANNAIARVREERALHELEIAAELQQTLLPIPSLPPSDAWKLFVARKNAREVGGDYVDACIGKRKELYLVMVDVMGKGVSAAFLAGMLRTALHIYVNMAPDLHALITALNKTLCERLGELTMFATCAIACIEPDLKTMHVVNAGHCPVLIMDNQAKRISVEPSGPPLGLFENAEYTVEALPLQGREKLLMVTDGLYEWPFGKGIWGWDALLQFITPEHFNEPEKLWSNLQNMMRHGHEGADPSDDQTLLAWQLI